MRRPWSPRTSQTSRGSHRRTLAISPAIVSSKPLSSRRPPARTLRMRSTRFLSFTGSPPARFVSRRRTDDVVHRYAPRATEIGVRGDGRGRRCLGTEGQGQINVAIARRDAGATHGPPPQEDPRRLWRMLPSDPMPHTQIARQISQPEAVCGAEPAGHAHPPNAPPRAACRARRSRKRSSDGGEDVQHAVELPARG